MDEEQHLSFLIIFLAQLDESRLIKVELHDGVAFATWRSQQKRAMQNSQHLKLLSHLDRLISGQDLLVV